MSLKQRFRTRLVSTRTFTEKLLSAFQQPAEWTHQVHPAANHALWVAGHLAVSDNFFIGLVAPQRVRPADGYDQRFGTGSQPSGRADDYPPPDQVLAYLRERRQTLLEVLESLDEAALAQPTPDGAPDLFPDLGSVFETAIWHEGLHTGQVSVARRSLGHHPLDPS